MTEKESSLAKAFSIGGGVICAILVGAVFWRFLTFQALDISVLFSAHKGICEQKTQHFHYVDLVHNNSFNPMKSYYISLFPYFAAIFWTFWPPP